MTSKQIKLIENYIRKVVRKTLTEASIRKWRIEIDSDDNIGSGIGKVFTNFNAAVKFAESVRDRGNRTYNYIAVVSEDNGDKFAIIQCTPEYFKSDLSPNTFDSSEDAKNFRQAALKCIKTKQTQFGVWNGME